MEWLNITKNNILIDSSYYEKIVEHLEIMNAWKLDPDVITKFPSLNREFTLEDSFIDLLMKGLL